MIYLKYFSIFPSLSMREEKIFKILVIRRQCGEKNVFMIIRSRKRDDGM